VTVVNVNEPLVITSHGGSDTVAMDIKEDQTYVTRVSATDPESGTITYRISGDSDAALFNLDSITGDLTFKAAPDFETRTDADTDGIHEVVVEASDGTFTDTQTLHVTVVPSTAVDLLNFLKSDINDMSAAGQISQSTASGMLRTIDKAISKVNAGDIAGAKKLLASLKTTIVRGTPRKIPLAESDRLLSWIDQAVAKLGA